MAYIVQRQERRLHIDDEQPTFWKRFEAGTWEPETLTLLDKLLTDESTFLDIGAWVGPTSLWAAFTARRVISLEADPVALQQFRRNLAVNPDLARSIAVVPRALHSSEGSVAMGAQRKPGDSMSSILLADQTRQDKPVWRADTITPSQLADMVDHDRDLVIKMDIEGGEYGILPFMAPLLDRSRAILVSFHHKLAKTAFGWSSGDLQRKEDEIFTLFANFEKVPVGSKSADSSTIEWLFIATSGKPEDQPGS